MGEKNWSKWLNQITTLNRRQKLIWERFKQFRWLNTAVFIIASYALFILAFILVADMARKMETDEFLTILVAMFLGFQLFVLIIQTINQRVNSRITQIPCLPHITIKANIEGSDDRRGRGKARVIRLVNSGTVAHNVQYAVLVNDKKVKSNVPLFTLHNGEEEKIYVINLMKYSESKIEIRVVFEGVLNVEKYALFRKDGNEETFRTILKGF